MAIYICEICDKHIDDDHFPGEEGEEGLVCPSCLKIGSDITGMTSLRPGQTMAAPSI